MRQFVASFVPAWGALIIAGVSLAQAQPPDALSKAAAILARSGPIALSDLKAQEIIRPPVARRWRYNGKFLATRVLELYANGKGLSTTEDGFQFPEKWKIVDGILWVSVEGQFPYWYLFKYDGRRWVCIGRDGEISDQSMYPIYLEP